MSQLRINFLNYNPDLEDTENEGLTVAQNVVHEPEGYKPIYLGSSTAFAATGGMGPAAGGHTVVSCVAKRVGAGGDLLVAWLANDTLHVGLNGVTTAAYPTGYPLSFATTSANQEITAFDVCEYAGKVFFIAEAQMGTDTPNTTLSLKQVGYIDY